MGIIVNLIFFVIKTDYFTKILLNVLLNQFHSIQQNQMLLFDEKIQQNKIKIIV